MTAFDRILAALDSHGSRITGSGRQRMAQCPAHDDNNPSLSVTGIEGQALIYCHTGCSATDVTAALGLSTRDLFDDASGVRYAYTDRTGAPTRYVHRTPSKAFRQSGDRNGQPQLYRLPAVVAAVAAGTTVYLVEGEKDCAALEILGAVATTSPMGAKNFHKVDASPLEGAHVVIVPDQDDDGARYLRDARAVLEGFAASVKVARPKVGKDAADHVAAGYTLDELVIVDVGGATDRFLDWGEFWATDRVDQEWLVEPLVAVGQAVSTYSAAKVGKSLLWLEIAAALATGRAVLGNPAREPMDVVYIDHEQTADDLAERLASLGYDTDTDLSRLHYSLLADWPPLDTEPGGRELHTAASGFAARLVILDTVSRSISGGENDADTFLALYRHTVRRLKRDRIAFVRLDHSGKNITKGQRGSSAKSADVDTVWQLLARSNDTLTLKREASRSGYGPPMLWLRREASPLRHVIDRADEAHEREVERIIEQLDALNVPVDAGRPTTGKALRDTGVKVGSARLAEAMKRRRLRDGADRELSTALFAMPSGTPVPDLTRPDRTLSTADHAGEPGELSTSPPLYSGDSGQPDPEPPDPIDWHDYDEAAALDLLQQQLGATPIEAKT